MSEPAQDRTFLCRFFLLGEEDFEGEADRDETCDEDSCEEDDCSDTEGDAIRGGEPSSLGGSMKATSRLGEAELATVGSGAMTAGGGARVVLLLLCGCLCGLGGK